ncbi:hypothetical protein MMC17_002651 [Xylographa soralifera]|nr:hypothetical protein [Xylographa soralifera]
MGFGCLTADVIVNYAYGEDFGGLRTKDFLHPVIAVGDTLLIYAQWAIYFRKVFYALDTFYDWLPDKILKVLSPQVLGMRKFQLTCAYSIYNLKYNRETVLSAPPTIFDTLLDPAANKGRPVPSDAVLTSEAVLMLLAGTDTTANTLTVATYAVLRNPQIRHSLLAELNEAMPTQKDVDIVTAEKLRGLPYLNACFREALRLSHGAPGRLPRVVPASGTTVCNIFIPPETVISHSNYV